MTSLSGWPTTATRAPSSPSGSDGGSLEVAAAEMKINGEPNTVAQIITDGAKRGSNYRLVAARTNTSQWHVAYERDFGAAVSQFVATSTTGGGSPGAPAPPPQRQRRRQRGRLSDAPRPTRLPRSVAAPASAAAGCPEARGAERVVAPGGCTSGGAGTGWTCVNGGWLPPSPAALAQRAAARRSILRGDVAGRASAAAGIRPAAESTATSSCTTVSPGTGWTCVNGGWLPPGSGGGINRQYVLDGKPSTGWTCVNGGWLPPASGGTGGKQLHDGRPIRLDGWRNLCQWRLDALAAPGARHPAGARHRNQGRDGHA